MIGRRDLLKSAMAGVTVGTGGCTSPSSEPEMIHEFTYELNIEPAEPITDALLYAPTPVINGEASLTSLVQDARRQLPDEWSYETIDTERGSMLEIRAAELTPSDGPYYASLSQEVEDEIDTRHAFENEPGLVPRQGVTQVECDFPHPERWEDRLRCYQYSSELYGEYQEDVPTVISIGLGGSNSWWQGGWNGNEYSNRVSGTVNGTGWATASASFLEGSGNYR